MMTDLSFCLLPAFDQLNRGIRRCTRKIRMFSIHIKKVRVVNNKNKMKGKPTYRRRAYLKALKNEKNKIVYKTLDNRR